MKTKIYNLIIIDQSGSKESIKQQAISGVNETIQTIRSAQRQYSDQQHYLSLETFNSDAVKTIFDRVEVESVKELDNKSYVPDCCTPLYDAMGFSINKLRKFVTENDKVLVTIITDGYENASKEYDVSAIKALVEGLKDARWCFTYIGANQDVEEVASSFSVTNVLKFDSTEKGTEHMFAKESKARSRFFSLISNGCNLFSDNYFEEE